MLKASLGTVLAGLVLCTCLAQPLQTSTGEGPKPATPAPTRRAYRLDFVVQELDGVHVTNSRTYSMTIASGNFRNSVRTGSKIPVNNSYLDIGVNIDCWDAEEFDSQLAINVSATISSVADDSNKSPMPVLRNNSWNCHVVIPLKHQTMLFSSDDVSSKAKLQLEVTATPLP